jgi:hypothetical protein
MKYAAYRLKLKIGIMAGVGTFCFYGTPHAEDISLIRFNDQSYELPLSQYSTPEDAGKSITLELSLESRQPSDLGALYSKSALEDYHFRFRGMTPPEKPNALKVLKAALDEFEVLHGVRDAFRNTESTLDQYIKKFKLKGEFDFAEEGEKTSPEASSTVSNKTQETNSFFYQVFVPDRIKWNIDMGHNGNFIGAELDLGEYLSIRGDVGGHTGAFMMFKVDF